MAGSRRLRQFGAALLCALLQTAATGAAPPSAPLAIVEGTWLTDSLTELTIAACPEGYCGVISKIVVPEDIKLQYGEELEAMAPAQFFDANNKDPELRNRPIQGLRILTLKPSDNPFHYDGEIYNPQDGNVYAGSVEVMGADSIKLKGCVLYVLCQEQQWERVLVVEEQPETALSAD